MLTFRYLYVEKPFKLSGKANVFQLGENLYVIEPLEENVVVVEREQKIYVYDGLSWKEK